MLQYTLNSVVKLSFDGEPTPSNLPWKMGQWVSIKLIVRRCNEFNVNYINYLEDGMNLLSIKLNIWKMEWV